MVVGENRGGGEWKEMKRREGDRKRERGGWEKYVRIYVRVDVYWCYVSLHFDD